VEITLANFIYLIYPKMLLFQHTINTKLIDESFAFFFIQSLCIILHSQHFLVWTSHRPRLNDHVVGGPCHWARAPGECSHFTQWTLGLRGRKCLAQGQGQLARQHGFD
jgi:hypothetical protein